MWDPYLRLYFVTIAFIYREHPAKIYDISGFAMKDSLAVCSLGWRLMTSHGQDEPIHTYSYSHTRHFSRETCYGGKVGANFQQTESSPNTQFMNVILSILGLEGDAICKIVQEHKEYIDV